MTTQREQDERRRGQFRQTILAAFHERGERIAELEAMLSQLQWCRDEFGWGLRACPVCGEVDDGIPHLQDCKLAALLHKEATDE